MGAAPVVVELRTDLLTPVAAVWEVVATMPGVNAELRPWVRMTHPPDAVSLLAAQEQGRDLAFGSWLLAFGVLPIDRHHLRVERILDGPSPAGTVGFDEESSSWLQRRWRHERRINPTESGCTVTDRLTVVPRIGWARPLVARVVPAVFRHRHRRLVARFGAA